MAITIPTCAVLTAAGTTLQDYVTVFYNWVNANPGNFTVSNLVGGATPTSWTLTHASGFQLNFRVSGGTLLIMVAPNGGIANSAAPVSAGSVEVIGLPAPSGTSTRAHVARYKDALFFGWTSTTPTHTPNAFEVGRIGAPIQDQDVAAGIDGLGILAHTPSDSVASSVNNWYTVSATRQSRARVASATWAGGLTAPWGGSIAQSSANRRFSPVVLCGNPDGTNVPSTTTSPILLLSKYNAWAGGVSDSVAPFTLNESAGSNQAWMAINNANANTRHRILWDKTVDPTP